MSLELGVLSDEVTRHRQPLRARSAADSAARRDHVARRHRTGATSLSTGDALAGAVNVNPVGNGPFGVRPRLRGLDSTRMLVLVDGERLNTARQATDRTGAEVGLISPDSINRIEIINGAGTLMYGSDALAGTVNIITNEAVVLADAAAALRLQRLLQLERERHARHRDARRHRRRARPSASRRGAEKFDNYKAGHVRRRGHAAALRRRARSTQADTIDANFGFNFDAFPDPFNAPFVRTDDEILNSQAEGKFVNASGLVQARRSPHAARALPEPPHGGRRLPGLRATRTSSTTRRCRTATSTRSRRATKRRRSRRGSPTCR